MKRKLTAAIIGVMAAASLGMSVQAAQSIGIVIDGETVQTDTAPQITPEGRTIVPLRVISETLGADVAWDQNEKKVLAEKDGRILELTIGSKVIYCDGEPMDIDSPAQIVNGRTMVPVRVISESFGCEVSWDGETKTVYINTGNGGEISDFGGEVAELPAYHYKGDKTYMETIAQYLIDYTAGSYENSSVTIPVPLIVELNNSDPNDIKVWGGFEVMNYNLDGDILQCVSGGNYPGCIHLRKQGDDYSVTKFDVAQDGSGYAASLRKICLNDDARYQKFNKVSERRDAERKNVVSDYVKANKLKITAFQDYGWDPVYLGNGTPSVSTGGGDGVQSGGILIDENLPGYFEFSSGAGAWSTNLFLYQDGTFTGFYHDSNAGETGNDYPDGTVYECSFSGSFTNITKNGDTYTMTLGEVQTERPIGEEEVYDGMRHVAAQPYGLETGTEFVLYKPETPISGLSSDFLSWWPGRFDESGTQTTLGCFGILNKATNYGFFGYVYEPIEEIEYSEGNDYNENTDYSSDTSDYSEEPSYSY